MAANRLIIGCAVAASVTGCLHLPSERTARVTPWWNAADVPIADASSDASLVEPERRGTETVPSTRPVRTRLGATEPLSVLQQTEVWRSTWRVAATDFKRLRPSHVYTLTEPSTTATVQTESVADPAQDAQRSLTRVIEAGRKAAAPICNGC